MRTVKLDDRRKIDIRRSRQKMKRVYMDANATTPLVPEVLDAMRPYFMEHFGNASSIHQQGQQARAAAPPRSFPPPEEQRATISHSSASSSPATISSLHRSSTTPFCMPQKSC